MKKLKLELDALEVSSFEALPAPSQARGTVEGQSLVSMIHITACVLYTAVTAATAAFDC